MKKKAKVPGVIGINRKARFNYSVDYSLECGLVLQGTEVKAIRNGKINFGDSFCEVIDKQLWMKNLNIAPYDFGNIHNHVPTRPKKLLAKYREIRMLDRRVRERGYTLIPLKFYFKGSLVKVEVGVCKGKKEYDKRLTIKDRDIKRDQERELKYYQR